MTIVTKDGLEGKICAQCGEWKSISEFHKKIHSSDGHRSACKTCTNVSNKRRADANREKERERQRVYYLTHLEHKRAYRAINFDRQTQYYRRWYKQNKDKVREYSREYYRRRPEVAQKAHQRWEAANRNKRQSIDRRRRARKQNAEGSFTDQEWQALKAYYSYRCLRCGRHEPDIRLSPDHVVPLSKGGSNMISNIQPLCESCNKSKGAKTTDYRPTTTDAE